MCGVFVRATQKTEHTDCGEAVGLSLSNSLFWKRWYVENFDAEEFLKAWEHRLGKFLIWSVILSDSPEGFLFIKLTRKENIEQFRLWRPRQIPASAVVNLIREGKEFHMIPKAFVLHLFLVSPLNSLVLLTLDLCLTYMSANSNSFCNLKEKKHLSWVLIKVQPTCKAFVCLKPVTWKEGLDLRSHSRHSGILLPI